MRLRRVPSDRRSAVVAVTALPTPPVLSPLTQRVLAEAANARANTTAQPQVAPISRREITEQITLDHGPGDSSGAAGTPADQHQGHRDNAETASTPSGLHRGHGDSGDSPRSSWSAAELMTTEFEAPRWAVPGVLPEGLTLLAGPPKIGKSWLSLGLAVAVASGGKALGKLDVQDGDVLYLALEDTPRRLKNRLGTVLADSPPPDRLTFWTECPRFPEGAKQIQTWLVAHPNSRLVIIDVLARVKGSPSPGSPQYEVDYRAMQPAKHLADRHQVAVILVHHVRKAASDDFLDEVSGTNALAGAADNIMVLKRTRGSADGALRLTGRDVEEIDYALKFDPEHGLWHLLDGPAVDHLVTPTRSAILAHVRAHPSDQPKQIAEATGQDYELVKKTVRRMADDGQLVNHGAGRYTLPGIAVPPVPAVPDAGQHVDGLSPQLSPCCRDCGQRLLLVKPGRDQCERCRLNQERS